MDERDPRGTHSNEFSAKPILEIIQVAAAFFGLILMLFGLFFCVRILLAIFAVMQEPERFSTLVAKWAEIVGGNGLDIVVGGESVHAANLVAVAALALAALIVASISTTLITTGAKTVFYGKSERHAIQRILQHAFGFAAEVRRKPESTPPRRTSSYSRWLPPESESREERDNERNTGKDSRTKRGGLSIDA